MEGEVILVSVIANGEEHTLEFSEYDTVSDLKEAIHEKFCIRPSKQFIEGWNYVPESDDIILKNCLTGGDLTYLIVKDSDFMWKDYEDSDDEIITLGSRNGPETKKETFSQEITEELAALSFITKFMNNFNDTRIKFHTCKLANVIQEACLSELEKRKALILYFHNGNDTFSKQFCTILENEEVIELMEKHFFLLGWDVEDENFHKVLVEALNQRPELAQLSNMVTSKKAAALYVVPIYDNITIVTCLKGKISQKEFIKTLKDTQNFVLNESNQESDLHNLEQQTGNENDIGSAEYHKLMADLLGDRDYDCFEHDEHNLLEEKIAFSLYGPPQQQKQDGSENDIENIGYNKKQNKQIEELYKTIKETSNEISKWKDRIQISFIYNCTEPLPKDKLARAKKYPDYNPKTDVNPLPIFVLRKCKGSERPCRVFIDHTGRVYDNWSSYITKNKLDECEMILPYNGRYEVNENGEVYLERHMSPACGIDAKILFGTDIASVALGITSGTIFVASAIPAIAVAPAALVVGGVIGLGVGVYSIGRSAYTIFDRVKHKESLSFANSEARGAYMNIVAGSLGFVGAGATMVVSQLASSGINVGLGARAVVNTIGIVNIGAGGASLVNSGYDVINQWVNESRAPSMLTIVQLSSSILFFGNAVVNFKTAGTIIEETQARTLTDYSDSLRSNRHRKTFNKLLKSTINDNNGNAMKGKAEVIAAIKGINNKDDVFAVLTRSNKLFNEKGIKITASDGKIMLDGKTIDFAKISSFNKNDMKVVVNNLSNYTVSPSEVSGVKSLLPAFPFPEPEQLIKLVLNVLRNYNGDVKLMVLKALYSLLGTLEPLVIRQIRTIFGGSVYQNLIQMIVGFFNSSANKLEEQYNLWNETGRKDTHYNPIFEHVNVQTVCKVVNFFECAVNFNFINNELTQTGLRNLVDFFYNWFTVKLYEYGVETERKKKRETHSAGVRIDKVSCKVCGGYNYVPKK